MPDAEGTSETIQNLGIETSQPINATEDIQYNSVETSKPAELPLAQREFVRNDNDQIIDVIFSYKGKSAKLKDIFPGEYTIEIRDDYPKGTANYQHNERIIRIASDNPGGAFNLTLFHEAGHAVDFIENEGDWSDRIEYFTSGLYAEIINVKMNGNEQELEKIRSEIQDHTTIFGDTVANKLYEEYDRFLNIINSMTPTEMAKLAVILEDEDKRQSAIELLKRERTAWAIAVKGLRKLRSQGINTFDRRNNIIRNMYTSCLTTYQDKYESDLPEYLHFTKERIALHPSEIYNLSSPPLLSHFSSYTDIQISKEEIDELMKQIEKELDQEM
jgi:hypothetical protein